ncbi:hypothetical protein [Streptomyces cyaneofuscatus]|uniref:hypothetical protein n=1 Tax=Streptomyces cyaneofuscatus TaxID=66883 RepID=UPI0037FEE7B1
MELAAAQARQIETYDRLTRALEQRADVERAKNNSDKLVMVLLNMIHQLDRRVTDLVQERDQLRSQPAGQALEDAERKLARAEEQEQRARAELRRAEEKQRQAETLEAVLQDQLRRLTDELDRLRASDTTPPLNTLPALPDEPEAGPVSSDPVGDDIDAVLARASQVNDEDNTTLNRLTSELPEPATWWVVQDNPPDNSPSEESQRKAEADEETSESLHTRLQFAVKVGGRGDPIRAVDLLNELMPDLTRVLGADHPDTLTARLGAAYYAGEIGDATGAAAANSPPSSTTAPVHSAPTTGTPSAHGREPRTGRATRGMRPVPPPPSPPSSTTAPVYSAPTTPAPSPHGTTPRAGRVKTADPSRSTDHRERNARYREWLYRCSLRPE